MNALVWLFGEKNWSERCAWMKPVTDPIMGWIMPSDPAIENEYVR